MAKGEYFKLYKIEGVTNKKKKRNEQAFDFAVTQGLKAPTDPLLKEFTRRLLGDVKTAKRCRTLQDRFPTATLPELVTYDFLQQKNIRFDFQPALFGGRNVRGGVVPDFMVYRGGGGVAWLIQGDYFHGQQFQAKFGQVGRDRAAKLRLVGKSFNGVEIKAVISLWEEDIYSKRPQVFEYALNGIELRVTA